MIILTKEESEAIEKLKANRGKIEFKIDKDFAKALDNGLDRYVYFDTTSAIDTKINEILKTASERTTTKYKEKELLKDIKNLTYYDVASQLKLIKIKNEFSMLDENGEEIPNSNNIELTYIPKEELSDMLIFNQLNQLQSFKSGCDREAINLIYRYKNNSITEREVLEWFKAKNLDEISYNPIEVKKEVIDSFSIGGELERPTVLNPIESFISTNDKVSRELFTGDKLKNIISVDYSELDHIQFYTHGEDLTAFDWEVHNAVCTIFQEGGQDVFKLNDIFRVLTGGSRVNVSPTMQKEIRESLSLLSHVKIKIENDKRSEEYEGNVLFMESMRYKDPKTGKIICDYYHLITPPRLLQRAAASNCVARVPRELLKTSMGNDKEVIALRGQLIRHISSMKSTANTYEIKKESRKNTKYKALSTTILYDTLFEKCKIFENTKDTADAIRAKRKKVYPKIEKLLNEFIQTGFIDGYEIIYGERNSKKGVKVEF